MTSREIGLRLSHLRDLRRLTTAALAAKVGLSQAQISRLENGRQGFRSPTLMRIARALSVPPFYFLMIDDEWETYQAGLTARGRERLDVPSFRADGTGGTDGEARSSRGPAH